ncbi:hypothetical protein PMIN04_012197 [Paraphaeosphaeria minitans]|uniref:Uncharacterized protein n=1 Tax=Paraphaeosphaeria minitans TaxID=565426 RepID=A0A9P6GEV9_9PLEO|nr:hypothetical protein PMIN01_08141 [Paraphaeosphaeria minitans]
MAQSPRSPLPNAHSHCRVDSLDPSNFPKELMHLSPQEGAKQIDQATHQNWERPGDRPFRTVSKKSNGRAEDIEAVKDSAHERFEDFHAKMIVWNHFTKGLNGSIQRAHELLDGGEYDKAKETFERVIRTTDQFLKDHPS